MQTADGSLRYLLLDYAAAAACGGGGALAALVVPHGWGMFPAMLASMVLGMAVFALVLNFAAPVLGGFTLMFPGMFAGMWGGIIGSMARVMGHSPLHAVTSGLLLGLLLQFIFHQYDRRLRGEVRRD